MPWIDPSEYLPVGTRVRVRNPQRLEGVIVELRGPLGPGGARIYGVEYPGDPEPRYVEYREDQLEVIPAKS